MDNHIRGKYLALRIVRDIDLYGAHSDCEAAAMGQLQSFVSLSPGRLVSAISGRS
jgi:hypothetical protein